MAKRRLGRGLDGMLPAASKGGSTRGQNLAKIEELHPNKLQPRKRFEDTALAELTASIQEHGILEPILVRRRKRSGFEIIAGERRWRAAQKAGLKEVPIFVRELTDEVAFEAALVENIQREDLNPIETALAFKRLIEEYGHTQEQVAERVGKDRSTVANALRLLKLPKAVLERVEHGQLSEGHGRALLAAPSAKEMKRLAKTAVEESLSVREIERRARALANGEPETKKKKPRKSANVRDLEKRLGRALGATVNLVEKKKGAGKIEIDFSSYEELDAIIAKILKRR